MRTHALLASLILAAASFLPVAATAADYPNPLPVDSTYKSATLPAAFPTTWTFTNSINKIELIDTLAKAPGQVRGQLAAAPFANMQIAATRPEIYVAETFYSRGTRGFRTDVVTVYDRESFKPTGEIVLPGAHRYLSAPQPNAFQLTADEGLGLVFAFTPAASVKVLNLAARTVVGEVPIPGCALMYPTGKRGFSTLCGTGTMLTVTLDGAGHVAGQSETKPFNDLDHDPLFSLPAQVGGVSYFTSFLGRVQPIDLRGDSPVVLPSWSLVTAQEAAANWRPSGWQQAAGGEDGRLYVIMQPNGHDGSHKDGGSEVWVFDVASHAKVATLKLKTPTRSIALASGVKPVLLAAGGPADVPIFATLDAYDVATGAQVNSVPIDGLGGTPVIFPVRR